MPHNPITTLLFVALTVVALICLGNALDHRKKADPTKRKPLTALFSNALSILEVAAVVAFFGGWCVAIVLWALSPN